MNMNFSSRGPGAFVTAAVCIAFSVTAGPAAADHRPSFAVKPVYEVDNSSYPPPNPILTPVEGSWGRLFRQPDRVVVQARLTGLNPDWVYNLHLWMFNNPAACRVTPPFDALGSRCTPLVDQGPITESSLVSLGGFIPDRFGILNLWVSVRIGEGLPAVGFFGTNGSFTNVVNGPGLTNPMGAEIQFDLARKGPVQKDMTAEQFQTMLGRLRCRLHAAAARSESAVRDRQGVESGRGSRVGRETCTRRLVIFGPRRQRSSNRSQFSTAVAEGPSSSSTTRKPPRAVLTAY